MVGALIYESQGILTQNLKASHNSPKLNTVQIYLLNSLLCFEHLGYLETHIRE